MIGCGERFTEGLDANGWLRRIYASTPAALAAKGLEASDYESFRQGQVLPLPPTLSDGAIRLFHADPTAHPLRTPSGRIEIFSSLVAAGLPGHPAWLPPAEWLGAELAAKHPFQLVANQPAGQLHSQMDFGAASQATKHQGREIARLNPQDAAGLGIAAGDVICIWNGRGATLAASLPAPEIRARVVQLAAGAWYAPFDLITDPPAATIGQLPQLTRTCVNGNPNAVTLDRGASALSQGCAGQLSLVSVTRLHGPAPAVVDHTMILPSVPPTRRDGLESPSYGSADASSAKGRSGQAEGELLCSESANRKMLPLRGQSGK